MDNFLFIIFAAITALFVLLLIVKSVGKWKFCVLCVSVGITWLTLLVLYWSGIFNNSAIMTLLIGNSVVGIYYLAEKKTAERLHIFRLPFFLTLLLAGYELVTATAMSKLIPSLLLLAFLWLLSGILFTYRDNPSFKKAVTSILECCKNW
ncbi:hypothetical protein HZA42_05280 [Candidatus Peregrinibacteria bacterium]|nr:hypothetical protein [Candidatus Peregrinibacteria bacterium]